MLGDDRGNRREGVVRGDGHRLGGDRLVGRHEVDVHAAAEDRSLGIQRELLASAVWQVHVDAIARLGLLRASN